jgi:hypothetical protein
MTDPLTLSKINVAVVLFSVVAPSTLDSALTNVCIYCRHYFILFYLFLNAGQWLPKARSLCSNGAKQMPVVLVGTQSAHRAGAQSVTSVPQDLAQGTHKKRMKYLKFSSIN